MSFGLSENELALIQSIFYKYPQIDKVLLFGSRANATYKSTSDIDLALKGKIDFKLIARLKGEFEESNLAYSVDIIDYAKTQGALKENIDKEGVEIYIKNKIQGSLSLKSSHIRRG